MNFPERMKQAREDAGLSLEVAAHQAYGYCKQVTIAKIRRLEAPTAREESANPVVVWALARTYGADLAELSPVAAEQLSALTGGATSSFGRSGHSSRSGGLSSKAA